MKEIIDLFAIEGIDGSGKSSLILELKKLFTESLFVKAPMPLSEYSRLAIKEFENDYFSVEAQLLFILAAGDKTSPFSKKFNYESFAENYNYCFSDRSFYSSLAHFQAFINPKSDLSFYNFIMIGKLFLNFPSKVFYLDCPVEVAMDRIEKRGNVHNRENIEYLKALKEGYNDIFDFKSNKIVVLDATLDSKILANQIFNLIKGVDSES